jgi:hypothetical protein
MFSKVRNDSSSGSTKTAARCGIFDDGRANRWRTSSSIASAGRKRTTLKRTVG